MLFSSSRTSRTAWVLNSSSNRRLERRPFGVSGAIRDIVSTFRKMSTRSDQAHLAAHVVDEAVTDFLSVYNPIVRAARERLGWWLMPEFTFGAWLIGLCLLVFLLLALAPVA
jgi:hypothetical protein